MSALRSGASNLSPERQDDDSGSFHPACMGLFYSHRYGFAICEALPPLSLVLSAHQLPDALCDLGSHQGHLPQLLLRCRHNPLDGSKMAQQVPGYSRPHAGYGGY